MRWPRKRRGHHESATQRAVAQFLDHHAAFRDLWFHPANERVEGLQRAILSGLGVKPGVPDIIILAPSGVYRGAAIELKADPPHNARVTPAQLHWLRTLDGIGWYAGLCLGVDEGIRFIEAYDAGDDAVRAWHRFRISRPRTLKAVPQ